LCRCGFTPPFYFFSFLILCTHHLLPRISLIKDKQNGGNISWNQAAGFQAPIGVESVYSHDNSFVSLNATHMTQWGASVGQAYPQNLPTRGTIKYISATGSAYAALFTDGAVCCWGNSGDGGSCPTFHLPVVNIYSTSGAYAAVTSTGSVVAW